MRLTGKTLAQFGFSYSGSNNQHKSFAIGDFMAGHSSGAGSWSGTFRYSNPKSYGATQLYIDFYQSTDPQDTERCLGSNKCHSRIHRWNVISKTKFEIGI